MKSATKHRQGNRVRATRRVEFVRLKVEFLEPRFQPGSVLTGSLGWSVFADALGVLDGDPTMGTGSDTRPDHVPIYRARLEDASGDLFLSTSSLTMASTGDHDDPVSSPAQSAPSTGMGLADDLLNQVASPRADTASGAVQPARQSGNPASAVMPGSAQTVSGHGVDSFALGERRFILPTRLGAAPQDVLQHHKNSTRDGLYVDPLITQKAAANTSRDQTFDAALPGPTYAQPLYVTNGPGGQSAFIVATEQNVVVALNSDDGSQLWSSSLGTPVARSHLPCGNIDPLGVTGTPVIDPASRTIYVAAMTTPDGGTTKQQQIFALSLDDGSLLDGWPVDVSGISYGGITFSSAVQNQRGALLLNNGILYVPYGGHFGDCGTYHGWVVAVPVDDPSSMTAWATDAQGGGVWAPGGLSTDGTSIFAATGNTFGASTWMGGEAVIRLGEGATFSGDPADYFTPSNWHALDQGDTDVGGSGPMLIDVPGANPSQLVVGLGKNGVAYLLDRNYLGGIGMGNGFDGEGVQSKHVSTGQIINAAASFTTDSGTYVVFNTTGNGIGCPGVPGNLVGLRIGATDPPTIDVAWCADNQGRGSPIVTTTDGSSEPIVWTAGSESSNRLHAYNGETGEVIFAGGGPNEQMTLVRRFQTPIAVNGRILVAADNRLYAFTTQ